MSQMQSSADLTPLDYELPKATKGVMDAWMPRLQAVAIVTALLAGVEAQLIGNLKPQPGKAGTVVRFFAYSGLILNLSATLSTILLLIAVASLPTTARQIYVSCAHGYPRHVFHGSPSSIDDLNKRLIDQGETYILRAFGIARGWSFMLRHCIACFLGGCLSTFVHIGLNLWLAESTAVAASVMPAVAIGFIPPFIAFIFYMKSPPCHQCKIDEQGGQVNS